MLIFQDVSFSYGKKQIFDRLNLTLKRGEIMTVMGASGSGKTTLLNLAAGILKPTSGGVISHATRISYVFQEPRLFPWLTVEENLRAVLDKTAPQALIDHALASVSLTDAAHLYPEELSGGMKSRVSLARALAHRGDLYLLDEPFAALDAPLASSLTDILKDHLRSTNASALFVTHNPITAEHLGADVFEL